MRRGVAIAAVVVVVGALAGGFYLIGPPAEERARRIDEQRVMHLQRLRLAIDLYWTRHARPPATLEELAKEAGTSIYGTDPETGEAYAYAVTGSDRYELCAVFARASEPGGDFWTHPSGRHCYAITAKRITP